MALPNRHALEGFERGEWTDNEMDFIVIKVSYDMDIARAMDLHDIGC